MATAGNIVLSPIVPDDITKLFEWINNKELVEFNGIYKPVDWESHIAWFEKIGMDPSTVFFGIHLAKTNQLIGSCQLHSIHPVFQSAELQIRIGEMQELSKGYGSEAVYLLVKHGFEKLKLHRIYLHVFSDNERAIKAYMKNGFKKEGLLRESCLIDGKRKDLVLMSILKNEFKN